MPKRNSVRNNRRARLAYYLGINEHSLQPRKTIHRSYTSSKSFEDAMKLSIPGWGQLNRLWNKITGRDSRTPASPQEWRLENVDSSNLHTIAYDGNTEQMMVVFRSGGIYRYYDVPKSLFQKLSQANSMGQYFHKEVRTNPNKYKYDRIRKWS